LIESAVKYPEPVHAITLSGPAVNHAVLIEVADEGQGLPDGADERIFERFARAHPARTRARGGAGLGLAIVDAIVRAHGGDCSARNGAAGAVFTLRFPAYVPSGVHAPAFQPGTAAPTCPRRGV